MDTRQTIKVNERIDWLEQKLLEMRRVDGPDYTPSDLLQGRVQGEIGGLKWVLREIK